MNFTEKLSAHITPEWRNHYINYHDIKEFIHSVVENSPMTVDVMKIQEYYDEADKKFFVLCNKELHKVNSFFQEKLAEASRKLLNINNELEDYHKGKTGLNNLRNSLSNFYLSLVLIQNYQKLNYTGFYKLVQKHDLHFLTESGEEWKCNTLDIANFHISREPLAMIIKVEEIYTIHIENGNRSRALKRLRVPAIRAIKNPWTTFRVGFFCGCFICVIVNILFVTFYMTAVDSWRSAIPLYRGPFLLIQFLFLWSMNVYFWETNGVNHVLIFEINPRDHLTEEEIMEQAAIFAILWGISLLCYFFHDHLGISKFSPAFVLYLIMFLYLINPLKILRYSSRIWILKYIFRIIFSSFFRVTFTDFWIADQSNSLSQGFLDLQYFLCFYSQNSDWNEDTSTCDEEKSFGRLFFALLPPWFRFSQVLRRYFDSGAAFPHLLNACKYFSAIVTWVVWNIHQNTIISYPYIYSSPYYVTWLVIYFMSSILFLLWDYILDWGLFNAKSGDKKYLREELFYSWTWIYYAAIVENFILKFTWILSISLINGGYIEKDIMISIMAPFEVFRRFVWNFFRLENEHLNNCGQFRAIKDISIQPICQRSTINDQIMLEDTAQIVLDIISNDIIKNVILQVSDDDEVHKTAAYIIRKSRVEHLLLLDEIDEDYQPSTLFD